MGDEEKKAIKVLKTFNKTVEMIRFNYLGLDEEEKEIVNNEDYIHNIKNAINTALKLIETQESVIKHLWNMVDELTQNEENLKIELGQEKERNKKQFETLCRYEDTLGHYECEVFNELGTVINIDKLAELDEIGIKGKRYISKDKIKEKYLDMEKEYARKVYNNNYDRQEVKKEEMYKRQVYKQLLEDY